MRRVSALRTAASLLLCGAVCGACNTTTPPADGPDLDGFSTPNVPFAPLTYSAPKIPTAPVIDGKLDDDVWKSAAWTADYVDISGPTHPEPRFRCRGKMAWDDEYFYFAAELEEPHLWATYSERDSIIFHENDWEIFLDPDADTHDYFEFEINVLNTVWDLFLVKPYRDGGPALHQWDAPGLLHAVHHVGTINDGTDTDTGWTLEVAWPWRSLRQGAGTSCPPNAGDRWKVNFSRVQWHTQWTGAKYVKDIDPKTGKNLPEDNWVWSPQGLVNMHYPEMWGVVEFAPDDSERAAPALTQDDRDRWRLREAYYAQRAYRERNGRYARDAKELGTRGLDVHGFETGFEIFLRRDSGDLVIRESGGVRRVDRD